MGGCRGAGGGVNRKKKQNKIKVDGSSLGYYMTAN